jgi:hypothetical protein
MCPGAFHFQRNGTPLLREDHGFRPNDHVIDAATGTYLGANGVRKTCS